MGRVEADREDLMREAKALRRRGEFAIPRGGASVVAGFRDDGALSVYFGADPCYHFDDSGRLRRAFVEGSLYRTQGATMARLKRVRDATVTELRRQDLSADDLRTFLATCRAQLEGFLERLAQGQAVCLQQIPADVDLVSELRARLQELLQQPLSLAPQIAGKR